jgi:hypothetical protein
VPCSPSHRAGLCTHLITPPCCAWFRHQCALLSGSSSGVVWQLLLLPGGSNKACCNCLLAARNTACCNCLQSNTAACIRPIPIAVSACILMAVHVPQRAKVDQPLSPSARCAALGSWHRSAAGPAPVAASRCSWVTPCSAWLNAACICTCTQHNKQEWHPELAWKWIVAGPDVPERAPLPAY